MLQIVSEQNINTRKTDYYIQHDEDSCLIRFLKYRMILAAPIEFVLILMSSVFYFSNEPFSYVNVENKTTAIIENIYNIRIMYGVVLSMAFLDMLKNIEYSFEVLGATYNQILYKWFWSIPLIAFQLYGYTFIDTDNISQTKGIIIFAIYGSLKLLQFIIVGLVYLFRYLYLRIVICNKISAESEINKIRNENKKIKDELDKLRIKHTDIPMAINAK